MRKLAIMLCILALATGVQAATISYKILVNGADVDTYSGAAGTVTIAVQAQVSGNYYADLDLNMGLAQSDFHLADTAGHLAPAANVPLDASHWKSSTTVAGMINTKGSINANGYDVYEQVDYFDPGGYADNYSVVGVGTYTTVCSGNFVWDGTATDLRLDPKSLNGLLVIGWNGAALQSYNPTAATGDLVHFAPEPATMVLLTLGGIGALLRRRSR